MLSQNDLKKIKEIAEEFFKKTSFEVEIEFLPQKEEVLSLNIKTGEPQILIGERGQTLAEIQRLLSAILKRKITEPFHLDLDVADYKKKKIDYLKDLARETADEVALTKKEKILSPMLAYERRIIHLEIAGRSDVVTESIGQEPERKVAIRPYP